MKKSIIMVVLAAASAAAISAQVSIERTPLGSGTPGTQGLENAAVIDNDKVDNNTLHASQYLPGHPTAAPIWPRIVDVPCQKVGDDLVCEGYNWSPALGRGEISFYQPSC